MDVEEKRVALTELINIRGYVVCGTFFVEHKIGDKITRFNNFQENSQPFTVIARTNREDWDQQHELLQRLRNRQWDSWEMTMFWRLITD
jgi:hypothetical protein